MKASKVIQELTNDDIIIFTPHMDTLLQRCCSCGKWHKVKILRQHNGDIHLQYIALDKEPEIDGYTTMQLVKET